MACRHDVFVGKDHHCLLTPQIAMKDVLHAGLIIEGIVFMYQGMDVVFDLLVVCAILTQVGNGRVHGEQLPLKQRAGSLVASDMDDLIHAYLTVLRLNTKSHFRRKRWLRGKFDMGKSRTRPKYLASA
jgi:hypothetical protein